MNLFDEVRASVIAALGRLMDAGELPRDIDLAAVIATSPADPAHGEIATNAAMVVACQARRPSREVGVTLARSLLDDPRIAAADVAGPGFVNLRLETEAWQDVLTAVLTLGGNFGCGQRNESVHVICDAGATPAPLSLGQGRCAIFADALASLMAFAGHEVTNAWCRSEGRADLRAVGIDATGPDAPSSGAIADAVAALPKSANSAVLCRTDSALTDPAGSWTRLASDLARIRSVVESADRLIWICQADAGTDGKPLMAAASHYSADRVGLEVHRTQPVRLVRNGRSERVPLDTAAAALGSDILRFTLLARRHDAPLALDVGAALAQTCDNAAFRVQFAHVHVQAARERAASAGIDVSDATLRRVDLSSLDHPVERVLMRRLAAWPQEVAEAARTAAPHRVAAALDRLAGDFHVLRSAARDRPALRPVHEADPETTQAKIALARAVGIVIAAGLGILGVTPAHQMH